MIRKMHILSDAKRFRAVIFSDCDDLILSFNWLEKRILLEPGCKPAARARRGSHPSHNKRGNLQNCSVILIIMITKLIPFLQTS